jgi:predicted enzyme related to lactoylglutathione lyase
MGTIRVQNAYYTVGDMDRAETFYREALGLQLKFRDRSEWAQFTVGGSSFSLASAAESANAMRGAVVVFEVDDLEQASALVTAHGGRLLDQRDMGSHGRTVTFADPDGNVAQLFSRGGKPE